MPTDFLSLTFGAELECYLPEGATMLDASTAVAGRIGRPVNVEGYNHHLRPTWKVVTDGSLGDYSRGAEFVSPILTGEAGLAELNAVCEALTDFGCTVNKRCGLHVHVGARAMSLAAHKRLARLYQTFEQVIDGFMPPSRRASTNAYCRTLASVAASAIDGATSVGDLGAICMRASGAAEARYHKVNFAAFARHSTVEFRQHSGTLDGRKATTWAKLCLRMVAAAMNDEAMFAAAQAPTQLNMARRGSKAHQIGEMLLRPEGVTGPEICTAMGWPSVSVPQQARTCGLAVTSQRMGRVVRYYARRDEAQAPSTIDRTLNGFCALIGATDADREYLRTRTQNLSGAVAWAA